MIPQFPFIVTCDCPICKRNTYHVCHFNGWDALQAQVNVTLICTLSHSQRSEIRLFLSENDYEKLQTCVMKPNLN
jgi:hypothetical protein